MLAFSLGGVLYDAFGWQGGMGVTVLLGAVAFISALIILGETHRSRQSRLSLESVALNYIGLLRNKQFLLFAGNLGFQLEHPLDLGCQRRLANCSRIEGYMIGEVRDWEVGAPPCGWVFAINVRPEARVGGIGARLLQAIGAGFRACGVRSLRTLLARDNALVLSFFRSQGLMAAPVIPLEKVLD